MKSCDDISGNSVVAVQEFNTIYLQFNMECKVQVKLKVIYQSSTITRKKEVSASTVDCFMIWLNSDVILFDWAIITLQPVRKIGKVTGHSML